MKVTIGRLKELIKEAFMSRDAIISLIASVPSDQAATADYIDDETGEVLWEEGQLASETEFHPSRKK